MSKFETEDYSLLVEYSSESGMAVLKLIRGNDHIVPLDVLRGSPVYEALLNVTTYAFIGMAECARELEAK